MARQAVGLDIGTSCVKAIQLKRVGKSGIELEKFGIAQVNPEGPPPTGVAALEAKVRAIKAALSNAQISTKQVVSSVSGEAIIVRYIQLPAMPENELKEALKWEAEEYIPFSINDCNIDSTILSKSADGAMVNVLLVAAKKDLINEHVEVIRRANLQPVIVDVDSFAFLNCFEQNYQSASEKVVALINIGSNVTNINIYHNGVSHFSRDIAIAGDSITTAIQNKLGKDWMEAEQLKIMEGVPVAEPAFNPAAGGEGGEGMNLMESIRGTVERLTGEQLSNEAPEELAAKVIRNVLNTLISEIRRSIQFFENQEKGRPVQQVILGGGTARLKNMGDFFGRELGLPVEMMNPLQRIGAPRGRGIDLNALEVSKVLLGVGIGLALRKVLE